MITHLGVIADGNRRWAKEHGLPSIEGHKKGLDTIEKIVDAIKNNIHDVVDELVDEMERRTSFNYNVNAYTG